MTAIDANDQELRVGHLVRRKTAETNEDARRWWGHGSSDQFLGIVEHIVGHAVVTEKGVFCGRLVVRT